VAALSKILVINPHNSALQYSFGKTGKTGKMPRRSTMKCYMKSAIAMFAKESIKFDTVVRESCSNDRGEVGM
jgi:hypothetical protein